MNIHGANCKLIRYFNNSWQLVRSVCLFPLSVSLVALFLPKRHYGATLVQKLDLVYYSL